MEKQEIVLAVLSTSEGEPFTPVQVQKLFFLIDKNIAEIIGGSLYNFQPYNYGPFDINVYHDLEFLSNQGFVNINPMGRWRTYSLTPLGQKEGERFFNLLPSEAKNYIRKSSDFVRSLSFTALVSAIYKAYPEMRQNSVFE